MNSAYQRDGAAPFKWQAGPGTQQPVQIGRCQRADRIIGHYGIEAPLAHRFYHKPSIVLDQAGNPSRMLHRIWRFDGGEILRAGKYCGSQEVERLKLPPNRYSSPRVSPDGTRIAFEIDYGRETNVYTYDLSGTSTMQRLTFGGNNRFPIWSPDSKRVAFQSDREGDLAIWQSAVGGAAERLTKPEQGTSHAAESWHPTADLILFSVTKGSDVSLWTFSLHDRRASPFDDVHSFYTTGARFSPDGRWIAYTIAERDENTTIYVQPFPGTGSKFPLFVKGSNLTPHKVAWSPDGKELFYVPRIAEFEAVAITTKPTFAFGNAVRVPRSFTSGAPNMRTLYDVVPSGPHTGKFVGLLRPGQLQSLTRINSQIQVVLNWFEELRARVPLEK